MGEPVDPGYQPPQPFAPPEQRGQPWPAQPAQPYGYPYGAPWLPPLQPPPSHGTRNVLIAAVVVIGLALVGVGLYAFTRSGSQPNRVAVPETFAGFVREHDATSNQIQSTLTGMLSNIGGSANQIFEAATIAVYTSDSDVSDKAVVLALPTASLPGGESADQVTSQLILYMGTSVATFPPGDRGGALRCGVTSLGAASESACAWSDPISTGMLISVHAGGQPRSPSRLSAITRSLSDQIDEGH